MRELDQQEVNYIGGGHTHESDGISTTAIKTVTMAGVGFGVGFSIQKYLIRAGVNPVLAGTFGTGAASVASSLTCLFIGMGKEYIYSSEVSNKQ